MKPESFDFIFLDPYNLHPDDGPEIVKRVIEACRHGGKVIFTLTELF